MDKCHGDVSIPACEVDTMEKIKVLIWNVVCVWYKRAELAWIWIVVNI